MADKGELMRVLLLPVAFCIVVNGLGQTAGSAQSTAMAHTDSLSNVVFFDDFNDNKNNWTIDDNKRGSSRLDGGLYYLKAAGHAYGEAQEVHIDTRKDFEIEASIKILDGNSEHKYYYSMLFWGRNAKDGYYFTFAKDGYASVEICSGKNQRDCIVKSGSLQKTTLNPEGFNVYRIRKTGNTFSFFVNGTLFYSMPFAPFFGNLVGFGAGRKVSLAVDYLKVIYL